MSRFKLGLLSILVVLAVGAVASASASAGPLHYYHAGGTKLTEGASLKITSLGGLQRLQGVAAGAALEIHCGHLDNSGTVVNPSGGGLGTTTATLLYLSCVVRTAVATGCVVLGGMVTAETLGLLEGTNAAPVVKFTPTEAHGETFVEIMLESCSLKALNTTFKVQGSALGKINNTTSGITVKEVKGSSSMLKFAGNEAGLEGEEDIVEMEGGGKLEVKE